jgi:hypothetical protein
LFFALEGKSASKNKAANVKANDPNWYVYWQQVAEEKEFGFGSQATVMIYDSKTEGDKKESAYYQPTGSNPWTDKIVIFDQCKQRIETFIEVLHHENGHHQSHELLPAQGGFGQYLQRSFKDDQDRDFINDEWESKGNAGYNLGFRVDPDEATVNQTWRYNWDHGWATADKIKNPPTDPYCNEEGYNASTGAGLCPRNEKEVKDKADEIKKKDWSDKSFVNKQKK